MWCVWSYCECCILFSPLPRVLCHSIVGLVPCLCDSVVSLWISGYGLCWVEGRVVSTVYCQLFMCCVVEWRWGWGVCGLVAYLPLLFIFLFSLCSSSFSSLLLVFGVVRAQPGEHARYPRTPLCSLFALYFPLLFTSRLSSCTAFPVIAEWRWVTMCWCVVSA